MSDSVDLRELGAERVVSEENAEITLAVAEESVRQMLASRCDLSYLGHPYAKQRPDTRPIAMVRPEPRRPM